MSAIASAGPTFADLVGREYTGPWPCWDCAVEVLSRMGVTLPAVPGEALAAREAWGEPLQARAAARAGDLVDMLADGRPHVGVCLDAFRVIHAVDRAGVGDEAGPRTAVVRVDRLAVLRRAGAVVGIARPRELDTRRLALTAAPGLSGARLHAYSDLVTRRGRRERVVEIPAGAGLHAREAIAQHRAWIGGGPLAIVLNGRVLADGEDPWMTDGDEIMVAPVAGDMGTAVLAVIAVVSALASYALAARPRLPAPITGGDPEERRPAFGRLSNDAFAGDVIPVAYGELPRYGGKVVHKVPGEDPNGSGATTIKVLICLGHGPVGQIGGLTGDADRVSAAAAGALFLNDQPIADFPGCRVSVRMGTPDQAPIPGFDDRETLREVGVGGVVLRNTTGSDRAGESASGEAFTVTTLEAVDAVTLRVRFPNGLYTTSANAQTEPRRVRYRARHRLTAGPGAWSAWAVYTVERTEQAEFYSSPRITFGTSARRDIQVERVSAEPSDVLSVDAMIWDQQVEVLDADVNYGGFAMLALELEASEQLTGVPRVSAYVKGRSTLRIWDGISDPSEPEFAPGWSDNPADVALDWITHAAYGLGSQYGDDEIDFPSLLAWREACAESVTTPDGRTRPRFAFNMAIADARDGIEWLRVICRAGRCTPVTSGGVIRFVHDGVQETPVEVFGDGSIVRGGDGLAAFEYAREFTTGGAVRPNQVLAQLDSARLEGRPDTMLYPEDGELWLGDEAAHQQSVRLDGATDPDQVHCELIYRAKELRGLSRRVKFTTSREVVVVQPGERFDLAFALPGWGLASGRLAHGSIAARVILDRSVTLQAGVEYWLRVTHLDGSVEDRRVTNAAGSIAAGQWITLASSLAQAPGDFAEYAIGPVGAVMKPFTCVRVAPVELDGGAFGWEIEGREYDSDLFDDTRAEIEENRYSTLRGLLTAPGPLLSLRAYERRDPEGRAFAELGWSQAAADMEATASFRIYRRVVGTVTFVLVPEATVARRGAVVEIRDPDRAYEFAVVAVSIGGSSLSPYDPAVPRALLVLALSAPPPPPPGGLTITPGPGGTYTLSWDEAEGAVGYQVLWGGLETTLPNAGAEDCAVLARTEETQLVGLRLAPGVAHLFFVRSVGENGRLSFTAASVEVVDPEVPPGKSEKHAAAFDLEIDGTLDNLAWNSGAARLELSNPAEPGAWTSPEVDCGSVTLSELRVSLTTANDADDPAIETDPFTAPSIEADQWGVVDVGPPPVVGMVFPPWPDARQSWAIEVRTYDGAAWSPWRDAGHLGLTTTPEEGWFSKYQVRVTLARTKTPYRPALAGVNAVVTH